MAKRSFMVEVSDIGSVGVSEGVLVWLPEGGAAVSDVMDSVVNNTTKIEYISLM